MSVIECPECGCPYDERLLECPECACPNPKADPELMAELARQEEAELAELAREKERLAAEAEQIEEEEYEEKLFAKDPSRSLVRTLRNVLARCDDFKGRSRRSEFWTFITFNCMLGFVLYMVLFACIGRDYITVSLATTTTEYWSRLIVCCLSRHLFLSVVIMIYLLVLALPLLSVTVRRLHDTNRSGLWILLAVVPFVLGLVFGFSPYIGLLLLSVMLLLDSVGDNKWGRAPVRKYVKR